MNIYDNHRKLAMRFGTEIHAIHYLSGLLETTVAEDIDCVINRGSEDTCEFHIQFDETEGLITVTAKSGALTHCFVQFSYALPNSLLATCIIKVINEFYFL